MAKLYESGFKIGIYSDYFAEEKVRVLGISPILSTIVSSADSDVCGFKPDSNGFVVAASKMGLKPNEIVYVGDRMELDGMGAKRAGMHAVIVKGFFKIRYHLFG
jgi:phosphoglycolate phosphatase/putative hydrolase of the HAD superfamily